MFTPSDEDFESMKEEIRRIRGGGQDAAAQAWLVWAEVYLVEVGTPGPPVESLKKLLPLIFWLVNNVGGEKERIQDILHDSIIRIMFNAKLAGRDLSTDDGHHAILIVRQSISEAEGQCLN